MIGISSASDCVPDEAAVAAGARDLLGEVLRQLAEHRGRVDADLLEDAPVHHRHDAAAAFLFAVPGRALEAAGGKAGLLAELVLQLLEALADPVAQRLNTAPKHVVSTTLDPASAPWQGTESVIGDDVVERIRALKVQGDGELQVHGSWQLLQTLIDEQLLDELRLIVFPTVVGRGKRLFDDVARPSGFEVSDVRVADSGAVSMVLRPVPFRTATYEVVDGKEVAVEEDRG